MKRPNTTTSALLAFALLFSAALISAESTPAAAAACTPRSGVNHYDGSTGITWTTDAVCGNRGGAPVYVNPNDDVPVGWLDSTSSWFTCFQNGDLHDGQNNIWYYTQGDRSNGHPNVHAWGFVRAYDVWTTKDPDDAHLPQCPFS
jgi:hypothetical protein